MFQSRQEENTSSSDPTTLMGAFSWVLAKIIRYIKSVLSAPLIGEEFRHYALCNLRWCVCNDQLLRIPKLKIRRNLPLNIFRCVFAYIVGLSIVSRLLCTMYILHHCRNTLAKLYKVRSQKKIWKLFWMMKQRKHFPPQIQNFKKHTLVR